MADTPKYLKPIIPFFDEDVDFSSIKKPTDILEFDITSFKIVTSQYGPFFEGIGITTIKDLAKYQEDLVIEGLDPDELRKIAMVAEMIFWKITQIAEKGARKKKIMLLGLDNAGKTSMLTALSEKYSSIKKLLPTRGLVRQSVDLFGYDIMSFDMGGQESYRETYFDKADMYFGAGGDVVLYCIDIQDTERYEESLEYFKKIIKTYQEYELAPPILVVFTKFDPDISGDKELNSNKVDLITKIQAIAPPDFDIAYAVTSIYERNSIERVFSQALKRISTSAVVIQELLKQFTKDIDARAATLVSTTGLVYGSYGENENEEDMLNNTAAYIQNLYLFHLSQGMRVEDFYQLEYKKNNLHFIAEHVKENEDDMIYLWILTSDLRTETLRIESFIEELSPLIDIFI